MIVIWDAKKWESLGGMATSTSHTPEVHAVTMCRIEWYLKIVGVDHAELDMCNCVGRNKFKRVGHPEPCGLGKPNWIITKWQRG